MMRARTYNDSGVLAFLLLVHLKETAVILTHANGNRHGNVYPAFGWRVFACIY
jgi:hypothetical protein